MRARLSGASSARAAAVALGLAVLALIGFDGAVTRAVAHNATSDYWEHAATLAALIDHGMAAGNPQVVSEAPSPRYMPHWVALAGIARLLGVDAFAALHGIAVLHVALWLLGMALFTRRYFAHPWAPALAVVVFTMGWGSAWYFAHTYQLKTLLHTASFPATAALGLSWFAWLLALRIARGHLLVAAPLLAGLSAYIALLHPPTLPLLLAGTLAAAQWPTPDAPCTLRPTPATLITGAALAFGLLLTEAWPLFSLRELVLGPGAREGARLSAGVAGWNPFYDPGQVLASLGPALLGGLWIGVLAVRGRCTLVVATCLALLVPYLAGTTVPVPLAHRLLLLATVTFHLACVDAVLLGHRALSGRRWWRPALAGLLLVLFVSNATLVTRRLINTRGPSPVIAHARAVANACPAGCVVLGTDNDSWPLPAFGLRIVGLLHTNPLIPDLAERRHATAVFFARGTRAATRRGILTRYGITHVLLAPDAPADLRTLLDAHVSTRLTGGHTLHGPLAHPLAPTVPP